MPESDIVTGYLPGLVGRITELHAIYYAREWGFGAFFETRVATELSQFVGRYDVQRDRIWSAVVDGRVEASLTIDGLHGADRGAHLRWFIAADAVRGQGLGQRLMAEAVRFCRHKRYARISLDTFRGLGPARHLYEKAGFRLVETRSGMQWGNEVEEQRFEIQLIENAK